MAAKAGKYYWLKLKSEFFSGKRIRKLRRMDQGDTLVIIYLKIQLSVMKTEGKFTFSHLEETVSEELALELDEDPELVNRTLDFLFSCGLAEETKSGGLFFPEVLENTGREGASAQRVREHRSRERQKNVLLQCNTEIEKEIDSEIEIEPEQETELEPEPEKEKETEVCTVSDDTVCRAEDARRVMEAWNSLGLQPVTKVTGDTIRGRMLRSRIREYGLDAVLEAVEKIRKSSFLKGQNAKGWIITFDWFVKPNNFPKVLEGNYDGGRGKGGHQIETANPFLKMLWEEEE